MASLTRVEAAARAALIDVTSYDVALDLDSGERTFGSVATVRFRCAEPGASTFLDVRPETLHRVVLNGAEVDPASLSDGRLPLVDLRSENEVVVTATMRYSNDGQGLHRSVDAADGNHYVYVYL